MEHPDLVGFVKRSSYRERILQLLSDTKRHKDISSDLDIKTSHVSRTLRQLEEKRLVVKDVDVPKYKTFKLTELGKEILLSIEKKN